MGLLARERAKNDEWERRRADRAAFYAGYENPSLAEFIGAENICDTCHAVTPNMTKHKAWHDTF